MGPEDLLRLAVAVSPGPAALDVPLLVSLFRLLVQDLDVRQPGRHRVPERPLAEGARRDRAVLILKDHPLRRGHGQLHMATWSPRPGGTCMSAVMKLLGPMTG